MQRCVSGKLEADLPGFRFHPTEQELIEYYLSRVAHGKSLKSEIIRMLNIYHYDPWELPGLAVGEREWYFFVKLDKKNGGNGSRPSRTTERGFWKATGSDRKILRGPEQRKLIGMKKTLVFYQGRAPRGAKTDWVMNEYRLPDTSHCQYASPPQDDIVLCKIYRKAKSMKEVEQQAAMEQVHPVSFDEASSSTVSSDKSPSHNHENFTMMLTQSNSSAVANVMRESMKRESELESVSPALLQSVNEPLLEFQLPNCNFDILQDTLFAQMCSTWLDQGSPYANLLNF